MREIADRIFYIEGENNGRYPSCHSLFIKDDISAIIDPASREDLMRELASEPGVKIILNTHYHEDHRTFNFYFSDAELFVHELDAHGYGSIEHFLSGFSVVNSPALKELWTAFLLDTCKYQPYQINKTFTDGFELNLGHTLVRAVHTPGHSAGHCCFFLPRQSLIYLGDMDLTRFGPWYASDNSSIDEFLSSIDQVRALRPLTAITSHGDGLVTENVDVRLKSYADIIHRRDSEIMNFLSQPRSVGEILDLEIIYRRKQKAPDAFFYWDDRWMIEMHLHRLVRDGKVKRKGEIYSIA